MTEWDQNFLYTNKKCMLFDANTYTYMYVSILFTGKNVVSRWWYEFLVQLLEKLSLK